jgi:multidrug efflux pump subunit AcrB
MMFGFAAIVCIIHDVLVSLAFLGMINGEFSLNIVAALLLIVGYSINDTVVMYDRVRENRRKLKTRMSLEEQLNLAMNQTLSRTILTSGSVIIVLIALILFGGKVIHEFAWILLIGVLAGTYSTVTIVPAVAIAWNNLTGRKHDISGPTSRARASIEEPRSEGVAFVEEPFRWSLFKAFFGLHSLRSILDRVSIAPEARSRSRTTRRALREHPTTCRSG